MAATKVPRPVSDCPHPALSGRSWHPSPALAMQSLSCRIVNCKSYPKFDRKREALNFKLEQRPDPYTLNPKLFDARLGFSEGLDHPKPVGADGCRLHRIQEKGSIAEHCCEIPGRWRLPSRGGDAAVEGFFGLRPTEPF